jgi:hypothetical protein
MKLLKKLILILTLCWSSTALADSPLTSTYFADVYMSETVVWQAKQAQGQITYEIMDYLANPNNPIGVKVAAVNALGWENQCDNYSVFLDYLKRMYNTNSEITLLTMLDYSTLTALAYVRAMSNYFDINDAFTISYLAVGKGMQSFTTNMINALLGAQYALDSGDWGQVYMLCQSVVENNNLVRDMHPQAVTKIMEYINLYAEYCNGGK